MFLDLKKPVRLTLEIAEVVDVIGSEHIFFEMADAEQYWDNHIQLIENEKLNTSGGSIERSAQDGHPLLNDDSILRQEQEKQKQKQKNPSNHELIHPSNEPNGDNSNQKQTGQQESDVAHDAQIEQVTLDVQQDDDS